MSNSTEKTINKTLVHRPWNVLDDFGCYDAGSRSWIEFDANVSKQIRAVEKANQRYIRVTRQLDRQSLR